MTFGVLGTGMVGDAIASKLVFLRHEVMMGARDANNPKASAWARRSGPLAKAGIFADAARFGGVIFNCTNGANSINALRAAGGENLSGKTLIDVANVLTPDGAVPVSLAEQIQNEFPQVKVVKTLNTVNCEVMVDPSKAGAAHTVFLSGNDAAAKETARQVLEWFGWADIIDLGDIASARGPEAYMPLWFALWKRLGTAHFNIRVSR
jgi:predicted dinucleotide-binding enzyme